MKEERSQPRSLREELIAASLTFLNDHRLEELTMRKLAALCYVTPHAIYNHFTNKDALLEALNERILANLTAKAVEIVLESSQKFEQKISALANIYLTLIEEYPAHWQVLQQTQITKSPSYILDSSNGELVCKSKYPGFPSLKTLNRFSKLPAPIIDALLKKKGFQERVFSPVPSGLEPAEDDPAVCLGQVAVFSFIYGLSYVFANGSIPAGRDRKEAVNDLVRYFFKRYF
ncbi:hypothetical protein CE91St36_02380 [Christensenellaceae bacterium]|nr:hypothetical protein CE91St36_02380 [Christensenellaceae bacterium]BDF60089.1 hypothetical protein CE91St37_02390 [Christensenellaceae bacterium]